MINNDVLRSIRYMFDFSDHKIEAITQLSDGAPVLDKTELQAYLKREGEDGFGQCPDIVLAHFLDGLVVHFRGKDPERPAPPVESRITNNLVLKKLRVACELKDGDMHAIFSAAGFPVSKPELSALFRQPGHKNYRPCGDQMVRNFLKGLTLRYRAPGQ